MRSLYLSHLSYREIAGGSSHKAESPLPSTFSLFQPLVLVYSRSSCLFRCRYQHNSHS